MSRFKARMIRRYAPIELFCSLAARCSAKCSWVDFRFQEASSPIVKLGFEGVVLVLQAVVDYAHSDIARVLNKRKRYHPESTNTAKMADQISTLVCVSAASMYFDLPGLAHKTKKAISQLVQEKPAISLTLLEECRSQGPSVPTELTEFAAGLMRKKRIVSAVVASLGYSTMKEILQDDKMEMSEFDLFELLSLWMEEKPADRKSTATELAIQCIRVQNIDPVRLSTVVSSSGLIPEYQLAQAHKQQALQLIFPEKDPTRFPKIPL